MNKDDLTFLVLKCGAWCVGWAIGCALAFLIIRDSWVNSVLEFFGL